MICFLSLSAIVHRKKTRDHISRPKRSGEKSINYHTVVFLGELLSNIGISVKLTQKILKQREWLVHAMLTAVIVLSNINQ